MKWFIPFTLSIGLFVGIFSVVSDNIPYMGPLKSFQGAEWVLYYLAVMINSLPVWFIMAMFTGNQFGRSVKESIGYGGVHTAVAITFYLGISRFFLDESIFTTWKEELTTLGFWYAAAMFGGMIGGLFGAWMKRNKHVLWVLPLGLGFQLFLNGKRSWHDSIGVAQNITFCVLLVVAVIYVIKTKPKKSS